MSYDLMVLDKHKRFTNKRDFLSWYDAVTKWSDDVNYDDYRHATPSLQNWFLAIKDIVPPLNGEFAPSDENLGNGEFQEADYSIAKEAIYAAFAWSDAERVHSIVAELAKQCDVAFFDISNDRVIYPDGFSLNLADTQVETSITLIQKLKKLCNFLFRI